jgi:hypothetical protein
LRITVAELKVGVQLAKGGRRDKRERFVALILDAVSIEPYDLGVAEAHAALLAHVRRAARHVAPTTSSSLRRHEPGSGRSLVPMLGQHAPQIPADLDLASRCGSENKPNEPPARRRPGARWACDLAAFGGDWR